MSVIRVLNLLLLVVSVISISSVSVNAEEGKPKSETKPAKEAPEIKDLELSGVVTKMEVKEGKPPAYQLKQENGILVVLPTKIGADDAKLEQYLDKAVVVKAKGSTFVKKKANGEEYTAIRLAKLISIEAKATNEEKPAAEPEKKEEEGMK